MSLELFPLSSQENLLPYDGEVYLNRAFINPKTANLLKGIIDQKSNWEREKLIMFGKEITMKRKVAWYGDEAFRYPYAGFDKISHPWYEELKELRDLIQKTNGLYFNSCLINRYENGDQGMGWHSDNEKVMDHTYGIASLSLGAERRFKFKHDKTKKNIDLVLPNGSLLIMQGETQNHWKHSLPKTKKSEDLRINLTFRKFKF